MNDEEKNVNITFTLPVSIASWLERKMIAEDLNRSQVARKVFRKAMDEESGKPLKKTKGKK